MPAESFADFAAYVRGSRSVELQVYATISGVPDVFGNFPDPSQSSAGWDLGERSRLLGTSRSWSRSLIWVKPEGGGGRPFSTIAQIVDWKTSVPASGRLVVEFGVDADAAAADATADAWVRRVAPPAAERTTWMLDASRARSPDDAFLRVESSAGLTKGLIVYSGEETLEVFRDPAGDPEVAFLRGKFGSTPQWYGHPGDASDRIGGPDELTSWVDSWKGRIVELYLVACTTVDGALLPLGTFRGAMSWNIMRGVIYEHDPDFTGLRFTIQDVTQLLERSVPVGLRRYRLGVPLASSTGWVYVEPGLSLVEWECRLVNAFSAARGDDPPHPGSGTIDLCAAGMPFEGGALATGSEVVHAIGSALQTATALGDMVLEVFPEVVAIEEDVDAESVEEGEQPVEFRARFAVQAVYIDGSRGAPYYPLSLFLRTANDPQRSILPAIGMTDDLVIYQDPGTGGRAVGTAQEAFPEYVFGAFSRHLMYYPQGGESLLGAAWHDPPRWQGTVDEDSRVERVALKVVDQEILRGDFYDAEGRLNGSTNRRFVLVDDRDRALAPPGSLPRAIVVPRGERDEDEWSIQTVLLFERKRLLDVFRWLAISNGARVPVDPYNVLQRGMGAGINGAWFDHDAMDALQEKRSQAFSCDSWVIDASESLRSIAGLICKATGSAIAPRVTSDGGYQISVVDALPAADTANVDTTIDLSWTTLSRVKPRISNNERRVLNVVMLEMDLDPLKGDYRTRSARFVSRRSIRKHGESPPLVLRLPWMHGDASGVLTRSVVERLFLLWDDPVPEYALSVVNPAAFALTPGRSVRVDVPLVMNRRQGGVGLSGVVARISALSLEMGPGIQRFAEVTVRVHGAYRVAEWVPSLKLVESLGGNVYRVEEHAFTRGGTFDPDRPGSGRDLDYYSAGWRVLVVNPVDDTTGETVINAIDADAGTIEFLDPIVSGGVYVEFPSYDDDEMSAAQYRYCFACDFGTFKLVWPDASNELDGVRYR